MLLLYPIIKEKTVTQIKSYYSFSDHQWLDMRHKDVPSYSQAELNQLVLMIEQRIGLEFSQRDSTVLHKFLQKELVHQQMTLSQYVQLLSQGGAQAKAAWESLAEVMTTKETYFFRDMGQLLGIQEVVIPELLNMAQPFASITIMSVGCASGEELYSLGTVFLLITGYNSNPFHRCMDNSPIPQNL
jgi:chemotaxis methyl-accepting protein methylase